MDGDIHGKCGSTLCNSHIVCNTHLLQQAFLAVHLFQYCAFAQETCQQARSGRLGLRSGGRDTQAFTIMLSPCGSNGFTGEEESISIRSANELLRSGCVPLGREYRAPMLVGKPLRLSAKYSRKPLADCVAEQSRWRWRRKWPFGVFTRTSIATHGLFKRHRNRAMWSL